jgi:hypothetical protein
MKRLYVVPANRRGGVGRTIAEALIDQARHLGYQAMLLDPLPLMIRAQELYTARIRADGRVPLQSGTWCQVLTVGTSLTLPSNPDWTRRRQTRRGSVLGVRQTECD